MVQEVLIALKAQPGDLVVDCTLGYGGHARELLNSILPGGRLIGVDADPLELPRTETRLRQLGFGPEVFQVRRSNFAGLPAVLASLGVGSVDCVLADLGVSSMQLDNPERGFSIKEDGPLDMRMNPHRPETAASLIRRMTELELANLLKLNSDEPHAETLARSLAGCEFKTTIALAQEIRRCLKRSGQEEQDHAVRRVFQALRIAVNGELSALDTLLRVLPSCLRRGGRVAIISFHSGEDRRVKKAFEEGQREGLYEAVAAEVIRPSSAERYNNPRSAPARLRWARRSSEIAGNQG